MAIEVAAVGTSRTRRIGFYSVVVLGLALVVFGLGELVYLGIVGWLGESALEEATEPGAGQHLFHLLAHAMFVWLLLISLAVQLRHPERKFAATVFALAAMTTYSLGTLVSGIFDPLEVVAIVLLAAAVWLHPGREDAKAAPLRRRALLAAIPILAGAVGVGAAELDRQVSAVAADEHAEFGHYGLMAAMAVIIVLAAIIGSSSLTGQRLVAGLAVGSLLYIGVASILYAEQTSSFGTAWGVATIGAGFLYGWAAMAQQSTPTT
jgi:hypothetical protein